MKFPLIIVRTQSFGRDVGESKVISHIAAKMIVLT